MDTKPFEVGKTYLRADGLTVTCLELSEEQSWVGAKFDDLGDKSWRYNSSDQRGRRTGAKEDSPYNVIPETAGSPTDFEEAVQLLTEVYEHGETISRHTKIGIFLSRIGK